MYSSRRYSVRRHINTIHASQGTAIPFVEYVVGRRNGQYVPHARPDFGTGRDSQLSKVKSEVESLFIRRVVEHCLPPPGDPSYGEQAGALRPILYRRAIKEIAESMAQDVDKILD
jgi:hypothetical protein